jgi:hypothetical protein
MALTAPHIDELFGGLPAEQRLDRFEAFKSAMSLCHKRAQSGANSWNGQQIVKNVSVSDRIGEVKELITKGMSAEQIADISTALDRVQDVAKAGSEWTLTNPLNNGTTNTTGLVPYDLDPALAMLVPRSFILRNSTSRIGGIGQAYEFRRILGVTNSNTGGVSNMSTFFSSTGTSATFGGVSLNRPSKISYAADKIVLSHVNQGVSDQVDLTAQFAGMGYTDLRQLSHTSLLWAHMLGEERNMLNGSATMLSISGISGAASNAASSATGLPAATATAVYATFSTSLGESQAITLTGTPTTTATSGITVAFTGTIPSRAIALNIYVNYSGTYYKGTTVVSSGATSPTTFTTVAALPSTSADNGSYNSLGYDGFVSTLTGSSAGYTNAINGSLSTSIPGVEFQNLFYSLYSSVIADPDYILTTASVRKSLANAIQQQGTGSSTGYRLNYQTGADGITIGSVVTAIQNESTGKMVDVIPHPYMPAGVALVHSKTLPFPDSGVSETVQVVNVQDLIVLEWPQIQLSWDASTYQYGTLAFRAPAWSAALTNIVS